LVCGLNVVCYSEEYVDCTALQVGQWYCGLNGMCYSEHNVLGTAQQVDSGIAGCM